MVSGALGGVGFDDGGISGELGGIDGEAGGGACAVQPAVITLSAMAARVDLVRFILHSSIRGC